MPDGFQSASSMSSSPGRVMPANVDAEQALIGAIFASNRAYEKVAHIVTAGEFAEVAHRRIFEAIGKLIDAGSVADPVTVWSRLGGTGALDHVGGREYLAKLVMAMISIRDARDYATVIHNAWVRREVIEISEEMASKAFRGEDAIGTSDLVEVISQRLSALALASDRQRLSISLHGAAQLAIAEGEKSRNGLVPTAASTGIPSLDHAILGLRPGNLLVMGGRPGMGKAQPLDAKILLANGAWTTMGDIKLGDRLASVDGAPSIVSGVYDRGNRQVYRVTFSDGRSTEACEDHLWRVTYRDWASPRVLDTKMLLRMLSCVRYNKRLSVDRISGHFGSYVDLPIDPYVLGALLGDGGLTKATPGFTSADPEILDQLSVRLGDGVEVRRVSNSPYNYRISTRDVPGRVMETRFRNSKTVSRYQAIAYPLTTALKKFGLYGRGSEEKFIPEVYFGCSRAQRLDLLRGLMDTDGWAEAHGSVRFSSASRQLAEDVCRLVRSLGGQCSIKEKRTTYTFKGATHVGLPAYVCRIRAEDADTYFTLARKSQRAKRGRNATVSLNIESIEPTRTAETRCISVTHSTRLYVTDDFVVTHNSSLGRSIAVNVACGLGMTENGELIDDQGLGRPVAYFALEESADDFGAAALAQIAGVPMAVTLGGKYEVRQMDKMVEVTRRFENSPLEIFYRPRQSRREIAQQARDFRRKHKGLALVVVDYLQLMADPQGAKDKRLAVGDNAYGLKELAKELGCAVLLLSQLGRQVDDRTDHRPVMRDLRESGEIEDAADVVMFPYREEYYARQNPPKQDSGEDPMSFQARVNDWNNHLNFLKGQAEVSIPKVRRGEAPVTVGLYFDGAKTRFEEARR